MKTNKSIFCTLPLFVFSITGQELPSGTVAGFDATAIDRTVNPCTDFYQYSCGTWLKNNPIPPDQASWGRFSELAERNRAVLHTILEKASSADGVRSPINKQIGDYYASCMDEGAIERKGISALKPELDKIAGLKTAADVTAEIARLHNEGVDVFFGFSSGQDFKDSTAVIAQFDQGGLGLPERDYYLRDDAKSKEIRQKYVEHLRKMFRLLGKNEAEALAAARCQQGNSHCSSADRSKHSPWAASCPIPGDQRAFLFCPTGGEIQTRKHAENCLRHRLGQSSRWNSPDTSPDNRSYS